jgi:hypothetical protein
MSSLCLIHEAPRHGYAKGSCHSWQLYASAALPLKSVSCTHWIRGSVDPELVWTLWRIYFNPCRESNLGHLKPVLIPTEISLLLKFSRRWLCYEGYCLLGCDTTVFLFTDVSGRMLPSSSGYKWIEGYSVLNMGLDRPPKRQ